jgi:mycofactocin precursor
MDAFGTVCQYSRMTTTAADSITELGPEIAAEIPVEQADEVLAEVLVEEISIDGMCGVY